MAAFKDLSDDEMMQIAVERSLADVRLPPDSNLTRPSSSSAHSAPANPDQRLPDPPEHLDHGPQPPELHDPQNCADTPTAMSLCLYQPSNRSNMAYDNLSDEEMMEIALERSLADVRLPPDSDQTRLSTSLSSGHPVPANPDQRLPELHDIQNCSNPPTAMSEFLSKPLNSYLQCLIMNGDAVGLMNLIRQRSVLLREPNDEGWIPLHEAAYYGQLQCVCILVEAHPDSVNRRTLTNQTALLLAAKRGNVSCVELLLKRGADPNLCNKERETPLFTACEHPNEAIVKLLLGSGAQVNRICGQGGTALHEASRRGQTKLCEVLIYAGATLQAKDLYGIEPLFTAAQHGHLEVIHLLAERGADVNEAAGDGASPLYEACKNGHDSAVEVLLALEADANRSTKSGLLPLHIAVQNNHIRIVSLLIPVTSKVRVCHIGLSPLHVAADRNRDEILELLIHSRFSINAELSEERSRMYEDRRTTALYFSVFNGNLEAAEMLLEAGADPNLDVFNPLLIAIRLGRMDLATLLLKHGANVNPQISNQPSTILLNMECLPMLKLLLDHGCDPRPCFDCPYGEKEHPAISPSHRPLEDMRFSADRPARPCVQFCEAVCSSSLYRVTGPIISTLLDYVGHVPLCSRLLEVLDSRSDWASIKLKASPPRPLMQLCRLQIRHLVGARRLRLLHILPLPVSLIHFLSYDLT